MAKRRAMRILLLPILAPIFMIGWLLSFTGESRAQTKQAPQRIKQSPNKDADLEMGLLAEMNEDDITAEQTAKKETSKKVN